MVRASPTRVWAGTQPVSRSTNWAKPFELGATTRPHRPDSFREAHLYWRSSGFRPAAMREARVTPPSDSSGSNHHQVSLLAEAWPVLVVAGLMVAGLLVVSGAYGFHGDEMYYIVAGQHPAFGYVDQPPLTPLLSAASVALLGVSPTAVRVLPALEMALIVIPAALIARDLGGSRRAQILGAITVAVSGYL